MARFANCSVRSVLSRRESSARRKHRRSEMRTQLLSAFIAIVSVTACKPFEQASSNRTAAPPPPSPAEAAVQSARAQTEAHARQQDQLQRALRLEREANQA